MKVGDLVQPDLIIPKIGQDWIGILTDLRGDSEYAFVYIPQKGGIKSIYKARLEVINAGR